MTLCIKLVLAGWDAGHLTIDLSTPDHEPHHDPVDEAIRRVSQWWTRKAFRS